MEKKKINKLVINKNVITQLNEQELLELKGGTGTIYSGCDGASYPCTGGSNIHTCITYNYMQCKQLTCSQK